MYTQEVLAVVLQQLLEQTPIPMLFMRTVIQSLRVCPKLSNFVMTILTKLISKQVCVIAWLVVVSHGRSAVECVMFGLIHLGLETA